MNICFYALNIRLCPRNSTQRGMPGRKVLLATQRECWSNRRNKWTTVDRSYMALTCEGGDQGRSTSCRGRYNSIAPSLAMVYFQMLLQITNGLCTAIMPLASCVLWGGCVQVQRQVFPMTEICRRSVVHTPSTTLSAATTRFSYLMLDST